jgi:hypothetical protein
MVPGFKLAIIERFHFLAQGFFEGRMPLLPNRSRNEELSQSKIHHRGGRTLSDERKPKPFRIAQI